VGAVRPVGQIKNGLWNTLCFLLRAPRVRACGGGGVPGYRRCCCLLGARLSATRREEGPGARGNQGRRARVSCDTRNGGASQARGVRRRRKRKGVGKVLVKAGEHACDAGVKNAK
jgi:hypothetical protein